MYTPRYLKRVPRIVSSFLEPSYLVAKQPYLASRGSYLATTQPPARYNMSFCGFTKGEEYRDHFQHGVYVCSKCDNPLFKSAAKYKHSTPWPAFTEPITKESLKKYHETEMALKVLCGKCGQALGHQFLCDGPKVGTSRF